MKPAQLTGAVQHQMKVKASYVIENHEGSKIVADETFEGHPVARVGLPIHQTPIKVRRFTTVIPIV
jgi:hypothetical protein